MPSWPSSCFVEAAEKKATSLMDSVMKQIAWAPVCCMVGDHGVVHPSRGVAELAFTMRIALKVTGR